MVHGDTGEGDESDAKRHRELIASEEESDHDKRKCHHDGIEDDEWLREAIELECEDSEYDHHCDEKC
jgi:hypothetical protein